MATLLSWALRRAGEHKFGLMVASMRANGTITRPMGKVSFGTQTVMCTRGTGKMTRLTAMGFTSMQMEHDISASGVMTSRMDTDSRPGLMAASTRVSTLMAKSTDKVSTSGSTGPNTRVNGPITRLVATALIVGPMVEFTRASGSIITCTEREFILGAMGASTRVSMSMIRSTVRVHTSGRMAVRTQEAGKMGNKTDVAFTNSWMAVCEKAFGVRVKEPIGRMRLARIISSSLKRRWGRRLRHNRTHAQTIQDDKLRS